MHVHRQLDNTTPLDVVQHPSFARTRDEIPQLRVNDGHARGDDETWFQIELCQFRGLDPSVGLVLWDGWGGYVYAGRGGGGVGVWEGEGCVSAETAFWSSGGRLAGVWEE